MITGILLNMIPLLDVNQFTDGDRLFYELGYKRHMHDEYGDNWIRTGKFKEIEEPLNFIASDKRFNDIEYLKHHNFMIIKSNDNE